MICGVGATLTIVGCTTTTVGVVAPTGSSRPMALPCISLKKILPSGSSPSCVISLVLPGRCQMLIVLSAGRRRTTLSL